MDDYDYTEAIAIDDAIRKECWILEDIRKEKPVNFHDCANVGFPTFSWSNTDPDDAVADIEVATGHKIARMITTIMICVERGHDWVINEHRMDVFSHGLMYDMIQEHYDSLPGPNGWG